MENDIDMQQNYGIMSLQDIERMFYEIERRIGVHERDVVVLEDRTQVFNAWWLAYGSKIADQLVKQIPIVCTVDRQVYEDLTKVEAPKVIVEGRGGEDAI